MAVVLAIYIAEMLLLLRSNRGFRRWKPDSAAPDPKMEALENEIGLLREQLSALQEQVEQGRQAQSEHAMPQSPYGQAIQLARQGVDAGEVAANCGISRGEAELIVAMHRGKSP